MSGDIQKGLIGYQDTDAFITGDINMKLSLLDCNHFVTISTNLDPTLPNWGQLEETPQLFIKSKLYSFYKYL